MQGQRVDVTIQAQADDLANVHQLVTGRNTLPDETFQLGGGPIDQRDVIDGGAVRYPVAGLDAAGPVGEDIEAALAGVAPAGVEIAVGGRAALYNYQNEISRSDLEKAELITFPVTLVVLLLVFGSAVAAGLPVLLAPVSLGVPLGLLYLLTPVMPLSVYVTNTATVIGIGVGIDYALFIVTRFREALADGRPRGRR